MYYHNGFYYDDEDYSDEYIPTQLQLDEDYFDEYIPTQLQLDEDYYNEFDYDDYMSTQFQLLTVPEIKELEGAKIRTTLPNIPGTVTAIVGKYNANTNRVQLLNIISDRTGIKYRNLTYLPDEISGLEILSRPRPGPGTRPDGRPRPGDRPIRPISFEQSFLSGLVKVKGTVHPSQNRVQIEAFIFGIRVVNETFTLQDRELVWEKSQLGTKIKVVLGLKPSGRTIYIRGESKIGGRIVGKFGPTILASW